jgi:phosphatidylglycerophosphate synthase
VKVYLLKKGSEGFVFFAAEEPTDAAEKAGPRARGVRGWLARKYRGLLARVTRSKGTIGPRLVRLWQWLQQFVWTDEPLLLRLRTVDSLAIFYPAEMSEAEAAAAWSAYLASRWRRHLLWALLNLLVLPPSVLLTPLPGPNVISYWFVYRAICHLLIVAGARRALRGRLTTEFQPLADLNTTGALDVAQAAQVEERLGLKGLSAYLERMTALGAKPRAEPAAPPGAPTVAARLAAAVPNALSASRIVLGASFPFVPESWRIGVVVAAAASDLLDGALGRLLGVHSVTGQILDPIADKLFLAAVLLTLLIERQIAPWEALLVEFRDLAVLLGSGSVAIRRGWSALKSMPPSLVGKVATASQIAFVLALLAYRPAVRPLFAVTACASVWAGIDYLRRRH